MKKTGVKGVVLYDDACGFCRVWIPYWGETLRRRGFSIASLQAFEGLGRLKLSQEEVTKDLRLLLESGSQVERADVYRYVMKRIWWAYPFFLISICPGIKKVFNWCYRAFADNRYLISAKCRLPGKNQAKN